MKFRHTHAFYDALVRYLFVFLDIDWIITDVSRI